MENTFRKKLRPLLRDYLIAEELDVGAAYTVCPRCRDLVELEDAGQSWRCPHCERRGDILDFAALLHPELEPVELLRRVYAVLSLTLPELRAVEAETLLDMEFKPNSYLVEPLLGKGVYLLAGASKIGKSWLVLGLADSVSRGESVWGMPTRRCEVLYLSLEDTPQRLQQRLSEIGGDPGKLYLVTEAQLLGAGFEEQLSVFLTAHPAVGLVIIDTLQRIRPVKTEQYSYAGDYEVMGTLKGIADEFDLTVLLVHHTRKMEASDSFAMISGTTGLMGCADGALVLQKPDRLSPEATLTVTGRETADLQLLLRFNEQSRRWDFLRFEHGQKQRPDEVLQAVAALLPEGGVWQGTATALLRQLTEKSPESVPETMNANTLTRRLHAGAARLEREHGVSFRRDTVKNQRILTLRKERMKNET